MNLKSITIKNFRNYEHVELALQNKNILFGRNDFGKTNFLYAIRFLFDPSIRNKGFDMSDYHEKNISQPIEITLEIDISDENDDDNEFIRAKVKEAAEFSTGSFFIQIEGHYDQAKQKGNPILKWGGATDELKTINQRGMYSDLDSVFEVVYLNPNLSPKELFSKYRGLLYKDKETSKNKEIKEAIANLNNVISQDERVNTLSTSLTKKYTAIRRENIAVELKSEHEVNGIFNHLVPYIKDSSKEDENLYPTSGDGRQKILAYALTNLIEELKLEERATKKITIFLIEEIENSLHPSMQQVVSRHLFQVNKNLYPYLFVTTHSEHVFAYMDEVNLVRIYRDENLCITNKSTFFKVPDQFNLTRKVFNESLAHTFFYDRVLLVEGMSEKILFEAVLEKLAEESEVDFTKLEQIIILSVEGIGFEHYVRCLKELGIKMIIKTDNDIRKVKGKDEVSILGINRCKRIYELLTKSKYEATSEESFSSEGFNLEKKDEKDALKKSIYDKYSDEVNRWKRHHIYLSEIELEEDLCEVIPERIRANEVFNGDFVGYLQKAKKENMNTFVNEFLDVESAKLIYRNEKLACIKALVGEMNTNECEPY